MKKSKIIVCINEENEVKYCQDLGISNFLFPLKDFSIGYETFSLEKISHFPFDCYLLINRLLTDTDIENFLKLKLPQNVKGLFIEDIGLYYALKNSDLNLINYQNHLNNSTLTVNYWLDYYDSLVLSTDITKEEMIEITNRTKKPLVVNVFSYPIIMYSRRTLVSNFYKYKNLKSKEHPQIEIPNQVNFKLSESEYGTAVFDNHLLYIREEAQDLDEEKIKYYLINTRFVPLDILKKAIEGENIDNTTKGFMSTKTIYKVGDKQ